MESIELRQATNNLQ